MSTDLTLSAVVPCFNGEDTLPRQLRALTSQPREFLHEIIVSNNMSTDRTSEIIAEFAATDDRVREVSADRAQGAVFAQNDGVRASTGDFIMLCGADDEVQPGWAEGFYHSGKKGSKITGCVIVHCRESGAIIREISSLTDSTWPGMISLGGGQAGFAREAFDTVGGFDEAFSGAAEDTDLFWRMQLAGYSIDFTEAARFKYFARTTPADIRRQQTSYGTGKAQLYAKHRGAGMPRRSSYLAPIMLGVASLRALASRPGSEKRLTAASTFGYNWGHIRGSFRYRCWYL
ncbi:MULTISPECIES: glycosyltransferase family 2 protein [unclassified Salinibacterium]|uniref:glycosyltransferase n=1 Tax=unclassified Salinibacterium TaxID=2632331 RepID=UPI0018CDF7E8|nr:MULTISPECIES: glycosyltransferase [unclassified Salinibacterium]MBH0053572.1 glycosyltransferase [Salinibacterium sp. SWN139]MBH0082847.1 glycosyltransferase [Salinibacterium sp. SWN167]